MATPKKVTAICATTPACDAKTKVTSGKRLVVSGDDNCDKDLDADCGLPAIPVQKTATKVELVDGSIRRPFALKNLQSLSSQCISNLLFQKDDGAFVKWKPSVDCGSYKLSVENGKICVVEDALPTIIASDLCVSECTEVDYLLGIKFTTLSCKGGTTRQVAQIRAVPKCCCTAEDLTSITSGLGQ